MFRRRRRWSAAAPARREPPDWRSYDGVAETYERVRAPIHAPPARDLVAMAAPRTGARVLDVGTGTGVAALAARETVGPAGMVVGIDPSVDMLRVARRKGVGPAVGAEAIDLPFRDATFDAVVAAFVIAFFRNFETALFDMVRVLRPGGRMAVSAWGPANDEFMRLWRETSEAYVGREILRDALRRVAPWEEHFSDPGRLEEALRGAGLRPVSVERRSYRATVTIEDYLTGRETGARGRFMREILGESLWERFRGRIREEFRARFSDPIGDTEEALLAVGTKP